MTPTVLASWHAKGAFSKSWRERFSNSKMLHPALCASGVPPCGRGEVIIGARIHAGEQVS